MYNKDCKFCHNLFLTRDNRRVFCSIICSRKGQRRKTKTIKRFTCKICGKLFERYFTGKEIKYCSMECYSESGNNKTICAICGKEFKHYKCKKRICCSRACGRVYSSQQKTKHYTKKTLCLNCNSYFNQKLHQIKKFCSVKCVGQYNHKLIVAGKKSMPDKKFILKANEKRRKNENYQNKYDARVYRRICGVSKCMLCGKKYAWIDAHHCNKNRQDNRKENLVPSCRICHCFFDRINPISSRTYLKNNKQELLIKLNNWLESKILKRKECQKRYLLKKKY
jgi:hypothetical protein